MVKKMFCIANFWLGKAGIQQKKVASKATLILKFISISPRGRC